MLRKLKSSTCLSQFSMIGAAAVLCVAPHNALAVDAGVLPTDGHVVAGSASFDYSAENQLHIHQSSDRVVIDWNSFNIGQDALTEFHQNSSSSIAANRVVGNGIDPTQILGTLKGNGVVVVLDQNGVIFGHNSVVDVGGLIASTGDIDTAEFMSGDGPIQIKNINPDGFILNQGHIDVADAGLAALVAPTIINQGVINAKLSRVELAAGTSATLDLYGDGLLELSVDQDTLSQTIMNSGLLIADGGVVQLRAAAAKEVVDNLIVNNGIISANSIGADAQGHIILYAEGSHAVDGNIHANKDVKEGQSAILQAGFLDASGYDDGMVGGQIEVLSDTVVLSDGSLIDASGVNGGGDIKIGGDYLGGGDTSTAEFTYVDPNAVILNNALENGDGGRTIVWSDDTTTFYGSIFGRGGALGGNGGFVETSGKINLLAQGHVDLTAENGDKGTYLLDPADITVYGNFDPTDIAGLQLWLDGNDVNGDGIDNNGANGSAISQWIDKSANGYIANSVGGKDAFVNSGGAISGLDVVGFNNDELRITGFDAIDNLPGLSYFYVGQRTTANRNEVVFTTNKYNLRVQAWTSNRSIAGAAGNSSQYTAYSNQPHTSWTQMSAIYDGTLSGNANRLKAWFGSEAGTFSSTAGTVQNNTLDNSTLYIGQWISGGYGWIGDVAELVAFDTALSDSNRHLMEQYQGAKWGLDLTPIGTGATEAEKAMAADGYGVFTTRYLEKISNTADIVLQASNSITLDLKGDTLSLANDRSISLQTTNGDILTASAGMIETNRTGAGGNITFTAGGAGDININHALVMNAQNGGEISLNAGGGVHASTGLTVLNGDLSIDANGISGVYSGQNAVLDSNTGAINATVSFDTLDISGASANLLAGYIGAVGTPTQDMANLITVDGQEGPGTDSYKFANFKIGYLPEDDIPQNVQNGIDSVVQQMAAISESSENSSGNTESKNADDTKDMGSADCLVSMQGFGCVIN